MRLIAKIPILYRGKQYKEGEELPTDDAEMIKLWEKAGSVKIVSDGETEEKGAAENSGVAPVQPENADVTISKSKATQETAESGLEGMAINGETEENLAGKVPKTPARKRG